MWLSGNCRASLVVYVSSKTQLTRLMQSSLQHPLQRGKVVAVFMYVLLLLYLSLSLSLILFTQNSAYYRTFPLDTYQSQNVCLEQQLRQFHWHYRF